MEKVVRPWGYFQLLYSGSDCWVKRIVVNPGQRLSLQSHKQREETWSIVSGVGYVETQINGGYGLEERRGHVFDRDTISIGRFEKHRIKNDSDKDLLIFIEIATPVGEGSILDENDITRYEDDYGRAA